jgi:hypothetical protein
MSWEKRRELEKGVKPVTIKGSRLKGHMVFRGRKDSSCRRAVVLSWEMTREGRRADAHVNETHKDLACDDTV